MFTAMRMISLGIGKTSPGLNKKIISVQIAKTCAIIALHSCSSAIAA